MNSECDDVTVDVIILSVNHFLNSSFIQPRVRQERTSPNSKQGVDVMAGNVKLKCKRTVQRAKGREQGAESSNRRAEARNQRAEGRKQRTEDNAQKAGVCTITIPNCTSIHTSTSSKVCTELVPRGPRRYIYSPREWLVGVDKMINQVNALSLMASLQDLETWLDSMTQYVCHSSGVHWQRKSCSVWRFDAIAAECRVAWRAFCALVVTAVPGIHLCICSWCGVVLQKAATKICSSNSYIENSIMKPATMPMAAPHALSLARFVKDVCLRVFSFSVSCCSILCSLSK